MNVMKFPVKTIFADLEHPIIILTISNTRKHIYKFMLLNITNLSTIKHGFKTVLVKTCILLFQERYLERK